MRAVILQVMVVIALVHGAAGLNAAETMDPHKPAAIATEEVPIVPEEIYDQLQRYQSMRSAGFSSWSPDGRGMLIGTRLGNSTQVHRVLEPGSRREQLTFFEEPASGQFIPRAVDGAMLVTLSRGGDENYQIYLHEPTRYRTTRLTDGTSRNSLGPVRYDGSKMVVSSNRRNGRDTDLYVADCRQPDSMRLVLKTDGEFWTPQDWSHDGTKLLISHYVSINESYAALLDVASGQKTPLAIPGVAGKKVAIGDLKFSPDDRFVYFTCDVRGEWLELGKLELAGGQVQWLSDDIAWNVQSVVVEPQRGDVAFTTNEDGKSSLYLIGAQGRKQLPLPLAVVTGLEFSPDGKSLGFTLSKPNAPSEAHSLRLPDGELTRWTFSETGGIDPATFMAPSQIRYKSFDGREIPAWYFKPAGATAAKPAAVLVAIHGGPESQYRPTFSPTEQYYLHELGLAVIHPNVRGSNGYGKTYLKLDNAERREDSVQDIGALLDWIAEQPELDARRVAVAGGSYGGYMVLASLTHFSDRLRGGIDHVGIASFTTFLKRTSPYRQDLRRAEYGDERDPAMAEFFERINPLAGAERIRCALLVAHGRNDPRVPFFEAQQIAEKVRSAGRPVWTIYASNEGHGFAKKDNRDYTTAVEVLFLRKNLALD
jgi:dipeptidyl aminopeptidase/acylaminoacyl peptidase